jgi:hypothetical protein
MSSGSDNGIAGMLRRRLVSIYRRFEGSWRFCLRSVTPEGIAVLRIFIIWEDYLFTDMKSVVVGFITSLHFPCSRRLT